jgi:predicted nucleic acid binding AN1-type Zn finger protein
MSTQTTSEAIGLLLPCPKCGNTEASIKLCLFDGGTFCCLECDDEFTAEDVRDFIAKWRKVLAWVDAAPRQSDLDAE